MKNKGPFSKLDERNKQVALKVIAVMYFLTIIVMQFIVIYRQFALGQSMSDFEDLSILMTINSLFLVSALLYFGVFPFQKIKIKYILGAYAGIIVLGSAFTYAKYNIFGSTALSVPQLFDKLVIIFSVSGLIVLFFVIFSLLGKRKMEKELED